MKNRMTVILNIVKVMSYERWGAIVDVTLDLRNRPQLGRFLSCEKILLVIGSALIKLT